MRTMMYLQKECISPELLCQIIAPLSLEALKECVKNSRKYKEIKDYHDLNVEMKHTMYGELLKATFIKKDSGERRTVYHNYEDWFNECHGIHYTCAFVITKYMCKTYEIGMWENEIKVLKKKIKDVPTFYDYLREQKINSVIELLSKEICIDSERLKSIFCTLKIEER